MLKIRLELDGDVCEVSSDSITHDTAITEDEFVGLIIRAFTGLGFHPDSVSRVIDYEEGT